MPSEPQRRKTIIHRSAADCFLATQIAAAATRLGYRVVAVLDTQRRNCCGQICIFIELPDDVKLFDALDEAVREALDA